MDMTITSSKKQNTKAIFSEFKARMGDTKLSKEKDDKNENDSFGDEYSRITEKMSKISKNIFLDHDTSMMFNDVIEMENTPAQPKP